MTGEEVVVDDGNHESSSDEEMRKLLKPNPSKEDIVKILESSYVACKTDVVKICQQVESYDDCNYVVEINSSKYILKVHNGVESDSYHESKESSQIELMKKMFVHLNQPQFQVRTSLPIPPVNSNSNNSSSVHKLLVVSKDHSPRDLVVTLLEYVPGIPMCYLKKVCIETIADAGRYLGRVCIALDDLAATDPEAVSMASQYHAWDGQHTPHLRKFVQYIDCPKRRQMVESIIDSFEQTTLTEPNFRKGILQADFNDANILVNTNDNHDPAISGVIDFGDSTYSWRILDVSVAMTYAMLSTYGKGHRMLSAAAAMLRGVHSVYPILTEELVHLRLLIACRLACSATLGAYSIHMNPHNKEYLSLHAQPAWNALTLLWGHSDQQSAPQRTQLNDAIHQLFHQACASTTMSKDQPLYCTDISMPDPSISDVFTNVRAQETPQDPPAKKIKQEKPRTVTFVTGNKKKLEEVKRILHFEDAHIILTNQKIDLPELQGNPLEIAKEKCALAAQQVGGPVITEDTSLCFNALNGLPGPYIKWFLDDCRHEGLVNMIAFSSDKSGYAQTVVAYSEGPSQPIQLFDGRTNGTIVSPRGSLDFGWDPIFQPDEGNGLTYAEMTKEGKDAISHRSRAFSQLRSFLQEQT